MIFLKWFSFNLVIALILGYLFISCGHSSLEPTEGPTEERILFIKSSDSGSEVCSIRPDGTDFQIIASHDQESDGLGGGYISAQWSPSKNRIVITGSSKLMDASPSLWIMDNGGNLLRRLTSDGSSPHWSGDGSEILFRRWMTTSTSGYYTIDLNSRFERMVLKEESPYWWSGADWSSDSRYILTNEEYLYVNDGGKNAYSDREIIQLKIHNGEKIQLTDNDVQDGGAQWSPDESRIVYISGNYTTGSQIKLMNSDGSSNTTLVDSVASYNSICWSPDGGKVAFNMRKKLEGWAKYAEGSDIFVVDINSGVVEKLTNFSAESINVYVQDWK